MLLSLSTLKTKISAPVPPVRTSAPRAASQDVVSAAADEGISPAIADQRIVAGAADDGVVERVTRTLEKVTEVR